MLWTVLAECGRFVPDFKLRNASLEISTKLSTSFKLDVRLKLLRYSCALSSRLESICDHISLFDVVFYLLSKRNRYCDLDRSRQQFVTAMFVLIFEARVLYES